MKQNINNKNKLGIKRIQLYSFSVISISLAVCFYYNLQLMGFPDGHLTELEQTLKKIYPIYLIGGILFALYFFYLGWGNAKKQITPQISEFRKPFLNGGSVFVYSKQKIPNKKN